METKKRFNVKLWAFVAFALVLAVVYWPDSPQERVEGIFETYEQGERAHVLQTGDHEMIKGFYEEGVEDVALKTNETDEELHVTATIKMEDGGTEKLKFIFQEIAMRWSLMNVVTEEA